MGLHGDNELAQFVLRTGPAVLSRVPGSPSLGSQLLHPILLSDFISFFNLR